MEKNRMGSRNFEVDSEKLIEAVKKNEQLWNKSVRTYHKKDLREAAWLSVCQEICDDWDDMDENDRNSKLTIIRKRWNNIRDYYKKDLTLQMNGEIGRGQHKLKKYIFSNKLDFMRPVFDAKIKKESFSANESNDYTSDNENEQEEYMVVDYGSDSEDSTPLKFKPVARAKTKVKANVQMEVQTDSADDESDLMFLKSLAPDMKVLSRRQKIEFKLGILQLYKNLTTPEPGTDPLNTNTNDDVE